MRFSIGEENMCLVNLAEDQPCGIDHRISLANSVYIRMGFLPLPTILKLFDIDDDWRIG